MAIWADVNHLNCQTCDNPTKEALSCDGKGQKLVIEGIEVGRCPKNSITVQSKIYLQAFAFYQDGYLPGPGDPFEQNNKVMEAINLIGNILAKMEKRN